MRKSFFLISAAALAAPFPLKAQKAGGTPEEDGSANEIVVQATRSGRSLAKEPIRVELIDAEEVEEEQMVSPGSIASMLADTPGVQTQIVSPGLGASNLRMQGLQGRYTQLLADGLPLFGGQMPTIGLAQIPPVDLGRVELIKGSASALYGSSALGGVINLISRRPGAEPEAMLLASLTSRNGQDVVGYAAAPMGQDFGLSLTGGYNRQTVQDLDRDGWADISAFDRKSLRARVFLGDVGSANAMLTAGATTEDRAGGTLPGRTVADGSPFPLTARTRRYDLGFTGEIPIDGLGTLRLKAAGVSQSHDRVFGSSVEPELRRTVFGEGSLGGISGGLTWLGGSSVQVDDYHVRPFTSFSYRYTVPAVFGQLGYDLTRDLTLSGSGRVDWHSRYGTRGSPRTAIVWHPGHWTIRGSWSGGWFAPTAIVDETENAGYSRLQPLGTLRAETAHTVSLDASWRKGPIDANITLFGSVVQHALQLHEVSPTSVALINVDGPTRTRGAEFLARYRWRSLDLSASWVHVTAEQPGTQGRRSVPLTPRDSGSVTASWNLHGKTRLALESFYVGQQVLEDDPNRVASHPYVILSALGQLNLGEVSLFANVENILDVRQTRYESLLLRRPSASGSWTVDGWAPTEGRVINVGLRWRIGSD